MPLKTQKKKTTRKGARRPVRRKITIRARRPARAARARKAVRRAAVARHSADRGADAPAERGRSFLLYSLGEHVQDFIPGGGFGGVPFGRGRGLGSGFWGRLFTDGRDRGGVLLRGDRR